MEKLFNNKIVLELLEKYRTIWALGHFVSLGDWDMKTYMPKDGIEARAEALGKMAVLMQELFLKKDFVSLINEARKIKDLNEYEKGVVRILKRQLNIYEKLPKEFVEEFAKLTAEANAAWEKAKGEDDFSIFLPFLEKIIELVRKKAEYLGYEEHPYDALLDEFEEGLTTKEVEKYFSHIKPKILKILSSIKNSKNYQREKLLEKEKFDIEEMKKLDKKLLKRIHYNLEHLRIDVSKHPFSVYVGKGDHRITTRYDENDFGNSYSSTMHEYGHALYDMQTHEDLHFTPIATGTSLILHESQSRFWENVVGRSKEFLAEIYEDLMELSPNMRKFSLDDVYRYINVVKPSLIRTEADEVTYHFHIMIRFEIEKELIEGKIKVSDLPKIWNEIYKEYLGVEPKSDREGVLQDVHWAGGSFGYFPTYSFGSALSAMWKYYMEKELGKIGELVKTEEGVRKIQNWLKEKIHQYGSTFTFNDLVERKTGERFRADYLIDYLEDKYKDIYP